MKKLLPYFINEPAIGAPRHWLRTVFLSHACVFAITAAASDKPIVQDGIDVSEDSLHALEVQAQGVPYGSSFESILSLPTVDPDKTISYGPSQLQTLAFYGARATLKANVLLVHGGCWSNHYSREHLTSLATALASEGYAVWLPEYRRGGDLGGGWPGTYDDIRLAITVVHDYIAGPLIAVGHSAGGHLVLLAAQDSSLAVSGVVGLAAITNLVSYGQQNGSCPEMVAALMGGAAEDLLLKYQQASVVPKKLMSPVRLLWGSEDPIVGADQLDGFEAQDIVTITGAGHFDLIHPASEAFGALKLAIDDVLTNENR